MYEQSFSQYGQPLNVVSQEAVAQLAAPEQAETLRRQEQGEHG